MHRLDRYILKSFLSTYVFSVLALCVVFIVVNLIEKIGTFIDNGTPTDVVLLYYVSFLPEIVKLLSPVSLLLAGLFTTGRLVNTHELTAMKAAGMSLYRYVFPLLCCGLILSFGQLYFNGWVVPRAVSAKMKIEQEHLNKGRSLVTLHSDYFRAAPNQNLYIKYYNSLKNTGTELVLESFSTGNHPRLQERIRAESFTFDSTQQQWVLLGVVTQQFGLSHSVVTQDSLSLELSVSPGDLLQLRKNTAELTFDELREYLRLSEQGGKNIDKQLVNYYGEYALPFANFIVILFGAPFSSNKRKKGLALEITSAMLVTFVYLAFLKVGQALGIEAEFPPMLSAWLANGLFLVVGSLNLIRMRS